MRPLFAWTVFVLLLGVGTLSQGARAQTQQVPVRTVILQSEYDAATSGRSVILKTPAQSDQESSTEGDVPTRVMVTGSVGYLVGAAIGGYLTYRYIQTVDDPSFNLAYLIPAVVGGTLGSATAVHLDPVRDGSYLRTVGTSFLYPAGLAGALLLSFGIDELFGTSTVEGVGWFVYGGLFASPFITTIIAHEAES